MSILLKAAVASALAGMIALIASCSSEPPATGGQSPEPGKPAPVTAKPEAGTMKTGPEATKPKQEATRTSPESIDPGAKTAGSDAGNVMARPDVVKPAPHAVVPVPQPVEPPPTAIEPGPQAVVPAPQAIEPAPQAVVPSPQAIETSPQAVAPAPQAVRLKFAWPETLSATVIVDNTRQRIAGGKVEDLKGSITYRMTVRGVDDGRVVSWADITTRDVPAGDSAGGGALFQAKLQDVVSRMATVTPDVVVDWRGAFVHFEGVNDVVAAMKAEMENLVRDARPEVQTNVRRLTSQLLSRQVLEAKGAETWNQIVGSWIGAELAVGRVYQTRRTINIALMGGIAVPMIVKVRLVGQVKCSYSETAERCVELEALTVTDDEKLAELLQRLSGDTAQQGEKKVGLDGLRIENTIRLITEPDTLLPYYLYTKQTMRLDGVRVGNEKGSTEQVETKTAVYRY